MNHNYDARAESECLSTVLDFFCCLDTRRNEDLIRLFAPEGVWHRGDQALSGPQQILRTLEARPKDRTTCHVVTNQRVRFTEPVKAVIQFYLIAYIGIADAVPIKLAGIRACVDELILVDSSWLILNKTSLGILPLAAQVEDRSEAAIAGGMAS